MLIETRLSEGTYIFIDAEPTSGVGEEDSCHPDSVMDNIVGITQGVLSRIREAAAGEDPPEQLTIAFGVRMDGNAVVSIAKRPELGQFQITARWHRQG